MRSLALVVLICLASGCDSSDAPAGPAQPRTARPPNDAERPERVSVAGGDTTLGFAIGVERVDRQIRPFGITRFPITVAQYEACVQAGACADPSPDYAAACGGSDATSALDVPTLGVSGLEQVPATCLPPDEASAYCAWVGGRLPSADEWLVAARGLTVRTHPWGEEPTDCAHHTSPEGMLASPRSCCAESAEGSPPLQSCNVSLLARVGAHAAGASPSDVEDVLESPAEIALPVSDAAVGACGPSSHACAFTGRHGAIEGARSFEPVPGGPGTVLATTFRCRFEEPSK